jgi:hypothetical protein
MLLKTLKIPSLIIFGSKMEWAHQKNLDFRLLGCLVEFVLQNLGSALANRKNGLGHKFVYVPSSCIHGYDSLPWENTRNL